MNKNQPLSVHIESSKFHIILDVGDETREYLVPKVRQMGRNSVLTCLSKWWSIAKATIASPVPVTRNALALNGSLTITRSFFRRDL